MIRRVIADTSIAALLFLLAFSLFPVFASADTATFSFPQNQQLWDRGADVQALQEFLNAQGFFVAQSGPGSPGHETTIFGFLTYHALLTYQTAHDLPATGFFGPLTRASFSSASNASNAVSSSNSSQSGSTQIPRGPLSQSSILSSAPTSLYSPGFGGESASVAPSASCSIGAVDPTITLGNSSLLTWSSTNALSASLSGVGSVALSGSDNVTPNTTSAYTLTVTNSAGATAVCNTTVTVVGSGDTTPPTVSLTAPANGATVGGSSVALSATASDNVAIADVQFKDNGANIGSAILSSPYATTWNTTIGTSTPDGTYTLSAVAADTSGNLATSSITVTVRNISPIISAISTTPSYTNATTTWTTDEAATSKVVYGLTTGYGFASSSASLVTSHSIMLSGLTASSTYHYAVVSTDSVGNTATSSDQTFTTSSNVPPVISNISSGTPGTTAATITWTTDQSSNSKVVWGLTAGYGSSSSSASLVTSHSITFTGLATSTTYHYAVVSANVLGTAATSSDQTLTTGSTPPPTVSLTAPASGATVSGSSVTLSATATDTIAVANVQFDVDGTDIGSTITSSPYTETWNSTSISSGIHTLYAVAKNTSGLYATSSESVTVSNPPIISSIASSTNTTSATITWTTNEAASSTVAYGTTTGYGSASSSASLVTSHSIVLSNLATSTTYHFQVQSTDSLGNLATSTDQTFTTTSSGSTSDLFSPGPSQTLFNNPFYTCSTNYYVSMTGSDSNNGSISSPWLTIQHAANQSSIGAGSCINVEPGTYAAGATITYGGNDATPTGYVVYRCTQLDACTITEDDHGFEITGSPANASYVVIDGFTLAASSEITYGQGIEVYDGENPENAFATHHVWVLNNNISGYGQTGVQLNDGEYFYVIHNTTYDNSNDTCDAQGSGISLVGLKAVSGYSPTSMDTSYGFRNVVEYNVSYDNILTQCGTGSDPYDTDGNGIIFDTWDGAGTTFGPYAGSGLAAFNLAYQNGGKGIQSFRNSTATIVVANNTSFDNSLDPFNNGSGRAEINLNGSADTTVINNIVYPFPATSPSDPRCKGVNYSVSPWNLPYQCPLQDNSAFSASDYAGGGGTDISVTNTYLSDVFSNNVSYGGTPYYGSGGNGNTLFNGNTINCSTGLYPNLCETNPLLTSTSSLGFTLQAGSPAIGYGSGTETYLPKPPLDAGAYQYGGTKVSITAPSSGATISNNVTLTAYSTSTGATISSVQFKIDGTNTGSPGNTSPYSITWNSKSVSDGTHTISAVAEDSLGNYATSSESVTAENNPPVISGVASSTTYTTATITWTTNKAASSTVAYGLTSAYGSASSSAAFTTTPSITLAGLATSTTYHFQIQSSDVAGNLATSSDLTLTTASTTVYSTWDSTINPMEFAYTNSNNTASCTTGCNASNYFTARGTGMNNSGYVYFEIMIGSSTTGAPEVGLADSSFSLTGGSLQHPGGFMWTSNGSWGVNNTIINQTGMPTYTVGGTLCLAVDFSDGKFWGRVGSGGNWNNSSTSTPGTNGSGVGGLDISSLTPDTLYPAALGGFFSDIVATLNTGGSAFSACTGSGLTGYSPWH